MFEFIAADSNAASPSLTVSVNDANIVPVSPLLPIISAASNSLLIARPESLRVSGVSIGTIISSP